MKKLKFFAVALFGVLGLGASAAPTTIKQGDFTFFVLDDAEVSLYSYSGSESELSIPSTVTDNNKTYTVTQIHSYCCAGNSSIEVLKVPDPVTYIGDCAFADCDNLKTLVLPASITYLDDYCFAIDPVESVTVYAVNPPDSPGESDIYMTHTSSGWYYSNIFKGSAEHYDDHGSEKDPIKAQWKEPSYSDRYIDATLYVPPMSLSQYKNCSFDPGSKRKGVWGYFKKIESIPNYWSGLDDVLSGSDETDSPSAIYDVTGRLVKADATESDLGSLPQGIYIFKSRKVAIK